MDLSAASLRMLSGLLEARTGQQLGQSRGWRIASALAPLLREKGAPSVDRLVARLAGGDDPRLADQVVDALVNNETSFFRDRLAFNLLLGPALARLEKARAAQKRLAIWCAGCSTGQEVYSIAMSFAEQKLRWQGWTIDILGTDVSKSATAQAQHGLYSQFEVQRGLGVMQMMKWFTQQPGGSWQVSPDLRRAVRFRVHSLLDPPPSVRPFDIILCRNVLLYFPEATRRLALTRLAAASADDGVLMLGAGETVIGQSDAFVSDPACRGLYIRAPQPLPQARAAS